MTKKETVKPKKQKSRKSNGKKSEVRSVSCDPPQVQSICQAPIEEAEVSSFQGSLRQGSSFGNYNFQLAQAQSEQSANSS